MSEIQTYHFVYFNDCDVMLWTDLQKEFQTEICKSITEFYTLYLIEGGTKDERLELHVDKTKQHSKFAFKIKLISSTQIQQEAQMAHTIFHYIKTPRFLQSLQLLLDNITPNITKTEEWEIINVEDFPVVYSYTSECIRSVYSYVYQEAQIDFIHDISKITNSSHSLYEKYYIQVKTRI